MTDFSIKSILLCTSQYGFRNKLSCVDAIAAVTECKGVQDWQKTIKEKNDRLEKKLLLKLMLLTLCKHALDTSWQACDIDP